MLGRKAWPQQTVAVLSAAWTTNVLVVVHTLVGISLDVVVVVVRTRQHTKPPPH